VLAPWAFERRSLIGRTPGARRAVRRTACGVRAVADPGRVHSQEKGGLPEVAAVRRITSPTYGSGGSVLSRTTAGRGSRMVIDFGTIVQRPPATQMVSVTLLLPGVA
jgi:hypothetical protein